MSLILFKVAVIGMLGWQLIQLLRKKKEKPAEPTYIIVPSDQMEKVPEFLEQRGPPPSYYPSVKQ